MRTPEDEEFLMATQGIVQRLKDEGRHEARQKDHLPDAFRIRTAQGARCRRTHPR